MNFVPGVIGRLVARNALLVQKNSPGLLFGTGMVGMVGSTVLACRATLKVEDVLDEANRKRELTEKVLLENPAEYNESDQHHDVTLIKFQTSVKIVKLYVPAVIVGGLSVVALTSSHRILTRRNAALTAAYAALDRGFREYRARVIAKYGEDQDRDFRYGTQKVEIIDPKTDKKKTLVRVGPDDPSIYARFFDQTSSLWSKEAEYNFVCLKAQQNWANDLLHARGHIFLNDVYDMLDIERSSAGSVVGWVLTSDGSSDNFVNFGVFDGTSDKVRDFVNGFEGAILLDFNVDGVIYDKIEKVHREALSWQRNN